LLVSFDSEVRTDRAANSGELRNRDTSPDAMAEAGVKPRRAIIIVLTKVIT